MRSRVERIHYLDGLRGFAALAVVFYHYALAFVPLINPRFTIEAFLIFGQFPVCIFFVLSGFVLSESSSRSRDSLLSTIASRYVRLTVPMVASLILAWAWISAFPKTRISIQALSLSRWLSQDFITSQPISLLRAIRDGVYGVYKGGFSIYNNVVWTMQVELFGSIVVYFLYRTAPERFRGFALAVFFLVALGHPVYLGFPIGCVIRELYARGSIQEGAWGYLTMVASVTMCALLNFGNSPFAFAPVSIAAGLVVLSIIALAPLRHFLDLAFSQFLGRISFGLYLVHVPLLISVMAWGYLHVPWPMVLKFYVGLPVFVALALALGWLMTLCVDQPVVRFLHAWRRKSRLSAPQNRSMASS